MAVIGSHRPENVQHEYTLDEAIQAAKIGRYQKMLILATGLSIMGAAVENCNIAYILPNAKCDLNLTMSQQGILSSVSFLGIVFTSYFWGFICDTKGRKIVLSTAAFGGFFFSIISAFATDFYTLAVLRFLAGAMLAGSQAGAYSYVSEFHTHKLAPRAVAFCMICLNGLIIYTSIAAIAIIPLEFKWQIFFIEFKSWRLYLLCNSFINLFNGIVFTILPESPKFLLTINRHNQALDVLKRVYAFNTGQSKESYPVKSIKMDIFGSAKPNTNGFCNILQLLWSQTKPIFLPPLRCFTVQICYVTFVIFAIGHGTFMWFPDFLVQLQSYDGPSDTLCGIVQPKNQSNDVNDGCQMNSESAMVTYQLLLGVGIVLLVTGAISSVLMKKVPPKMIFGVWLILSALGCVAMNVFTDFNWTVLSFVLFLSCCSSSNIILAVGVNLFPTKYRGMASSLIMMFGRLGGSAGSTLVGILLAGKCTSIFYIYGFMLISCVVIFCTINTTSSNGTSNGLKSSKQFKISSLQNSIQVK